MSIGNPGKETEQSSSGNMKGESQNKRRKEALSFLGEILASSYKSGLTWEREKGNDNISEKNREKLLKERLENSLRLKPKTIDYTGMSPHGRGRGALRQGMSGLRPP